MKKFIDIRESRDFRNGTELSKAASGIVRIDKDSAKATSIKARDDLVKSLKSNGYKESFKDASHSLVVYSKNGSPSVSIDYSDDMNIHIELQRK